MGFDTFTPWYWGFRVRDSREVEDAFGRAWSLVDDGHGNPCILYNRGLLKTPAAWRKWPLPEVIRYFTTLTVATVESYCHAGAPAICYGDDLAYKSGPMLAPRQIADLLGDACCQITATAHRLGRPIFIHSCGNSSQLLPLFKQWGFDGAHAFEPTAGNDLAAARTQVGSGFCLVGNIDISRTLTEAGRPEVEEAVSEAIRKASGGGFILAPAHSHGDVRVRNELWMLEAARRYCASA